MAELAVTLGPHYQTLDFGSLYAGVTVAGSDVWAAFGCHHGTVHHGCVEPSFHVNVLLLWRTKYISREVFRRAEAVVLRWAATDRIFAPPAAVSTMATISPRDVQNLSIQAVVFASMCGLSGMCQSHLWQ